MFSQLLVVLLAGSAWANVCPDGSTCKRGTCCKFDDTQSYACCPWTHGTCCMDGLHCCPEGKTCDIAHNRCLGEKEVNATLNISCGTDGLTCPEGTQCEDNSCVKKDDLIRKLKDVKIVVCPDMNQCPNKTTCCMMTNGDYGCCPLPNATCCPDKATCCPNGYACSGTGECIAEDDISNEL